MGSHPIYLRIYFKSMNMDLVANDTLIHLDIVRNGTKI